MEDEQPMIWVLQGEYGCGWEDLTAADTRAEVYLALGDYERDKGGRYRTIKRRQQESGRK